MRILIADDDAVTREILRRTISARTSHQVEVVGDGASALAQVRDFGPYEVLLLDWMMPEITGIDLCRRVRAMSDRAQPYIALITAKNLREEILQGWAAGADDFLPKPVAPDLLLGRLAVAARQRSARGAGEPAVVEALVAAAGQGDGELVVTGKDVSARIFFHQGKLAWVHLSDSAEGLLEALNEEAALTSDDVREVIAECRRTGARLTDTLLAFGLVDRASLRVSLLRWNQRQLESIVSFEQARTLFVPKKRSYAEELLFELEEVLPARVLEASPKVASIVPPASRASWIEAFAAGGSSRELEAIVERCLAGEGVQGAAILQRQTGACVAHRGSSLSPDLAWAHIHSLNVFEREEQVLDVVVVTASHFHLIRAVDPERAHFVYVVADASKVLLAAARYAVAAAVGTEAS